MRIKDPDAADALLDLAVESMRGNSRVIFYCACELPCQCHRSEVARLGLEAAKKRKLALEVGEWPGGEPQAEPIQLELPLAEFEREQIGERTRMALAHKKASGEVYAATPFGFEAIAARLVEVKRESAIVASILKMREAGASLADIANHLNAQGIEGKRGGRWFPSTVRYLIQRQAA